MGNPFTSILIAGGILLLISFIACLVFWKRLISENLGSLLDGFLDLLDGLLERIKPLCEFLSRNM